MKAELIRRDGCGIAFQQGTGETRDGRPDASSAGRWHCEARCDSPGMDDADETRLAGQEERPTSWIASPKDGGES